MSYRFGDFHVDAKREELYRGERAVPLNRKAVQLLVALIERQGELVTKEELLRTVWPRGATMNNVSQHVFMLRQALEDSADEHRYVLTVPRVGYRFVAPVERSEAEAPSRIVARHYCENARSLWQMRTRGSIESAIKLFELAIESDAECAAAYAGLAVCRVLLAHYMFSSQYEELQKAERDAQRALDFEPRNAAALVVLAIAAAQLRYEWPQAEMLLLEALRIQPDFIWAHLTLIDTYAMCGSIDEARRALAHAQSFASADEPFPRLPLYRGVLHYFSGEYAAAVAELDALLGAHPTYGLARLWLAKTLLVRGDFAGAQRQIDAILACEPDPLRPGQPNVRERALVVSVMIRAASGDADGARGAAAELDAPGGSISGFCHAMVSLALGDRAAAMDWLRAAIERHDPLCAYSPIDPLVGPLREMPEWGEALKALNLALS